MKRFWLLVAVLAIVFVVVMRQRLYVLDPLATVSRNGEVQKPAHVLINYSNDILLNDQTGGHNRIYLVQNWNLQPAVPARMTCLAFLACLTDAEHVTATPLHGPRSEPATMTSKQVDFRDENDAAVAVSLR